MEIMKFLRSSFPKGQWELKKDGKITAFFKAVEKLSQDEINEMKALVDETYPLSAYSPSLEFWAANFGIDPKLSREEQYQEFKMIFSKNETITSRSYFETFFSLFANKTTDISMNKKEPFMAGCFAGEKLCREGIAFSDVGVHIDGDLSEAVKARLQKRIATLVYHYYFTVKDKGGEI